MYGPNPSTAVADVWSRANQATTPGPPNSGPIPLGGGGPTRLPTVTNPNLPMNTPSGIGNQPPPIPQPRTPFPPLQPPGQPGTLTSNNYATANSAPSFNQMLLNPVYNLLTHKLIIINFYL